MVIRCVWTIFGIFSLFCGIIGIFLPLLPTTPFLLLATFCFGKGSERLHKWLLDQKILGRYIRRWKEGRGIPLKSKILAITVLWITLGYSIVHFLTYMPLQIILLVVGATVSIYIITRPTSLE